MAEEHKPTTAKEAEAADKRHRDKINQHAARFIVGTLGVTGEQAFAIIENIANGDVPHVRIEY